MARSSSSSCCSYVKSAPNSGFFGLNGDFGAPGQSGLNTGDGISDTRSLKRSSTPRASATSCASQFMMFLPCIARSSTYSSPNSRAATSQARPKSCEISSVSTESVKVAMLFQIMFRDERRLLRRARVVGDGVELDDEPAAEFHILQRVEDPGQIDLSASEFDESIRLACLARPARLARVFHVFQMQKEQPLGVSTNRANRIAAALVVVRNIELELHVARVRGFENAIDVVGLLADRAHVIVITERNAEIGGPLSDLSEELAKTHRVGRFHRAVLRALVGDLEVESADVVNEPRVARVLLDDARLDRRVDVHAAARERDQREPALREEIAQS